MVTAMAPGYLDMDADVASFVQLAKGTECVVAGGLEYYVRGYRKPDQKGITWASIEMLRAGAASIWAQGASSVYLFNYDCHGPFPFRGEKRQAIQEIGDPAELVGRNKRYVITVDMNNRTSEEGGNKQLPVALAEKHNKRELQFFIADDPGKAAKDGSLDSVEMTIAASGAGKLRIQLNGRDVEPDEQSDTRLLFKTPYFVQGRNRLGVRLSAASPQSGCDGRRRGTPTVSSKPSITGAVAARPIQETSVRLRENGRSSRRMEPTCERKSCSRPVIDRRYSLSSR